MRARGKSASNLTRLLAFSALSSGDSRVVTAREHCFSILRLQHPRYFPRAFCVKLYITHSFRFDLSVVRPLSLNCYCYRNTDIISVSSDKPRESARGATDEEALTASPGALRRPVPPRAFITRFFDSRESGFSLSRKKAVRFQRVYAPRRHVHAGTKDVRLSGNRRAVSRRDFVNKWKWRQMTPRERRRALSFSFFLYSCVCTSRAELHDDCEPAKTGITFPFLFFYWEEKGRKLCVGFFCGIALLLSPCNC